MTSQSWATMSLSSLLHEFSHPLFLSLSSRYIDGYKSSGKVRVSMSILAQSSSNVCSIEQWWSPAIENRKSHFARILRAARFHRGTFSVTSGTNIEWRRRFSSLILELFLWWFQFLDFHSSFLADAHDEEEFHRERALSNYPFEIDVDERRRVGDSKGITGTFILSFRVLGKWKSSWNTHKYQWFVQETRVRERDSLFPSVSVFARLRTWL